MKSSNVSDKVGVKFDRHHFTSKNKTTYIQMKRNLNALSLEDILSEIHEHTSIIKTNKNNQFFYPILLNNTFHINLLRTFFFLLNILLYE